MTLENVTIRPATLADTDAIADIYAALWCNWLNNAGATEDARLVARFNTVMQAQCSPVALVAEADGKVIAACYLGVYDNGVPRANPYWQQAYDELLAQATERATTADDDLEGALFGDSREKATGNRFGASDNPYAQGQLNLVIVLPEWQGRGLVRMLIERARNELAALGCEAFFLMTDNQADYAFYDHIGMTRIAEDHSQDTGDGFIVYIYGDTTAR